MVHAISDMNNTQQRQVILRIFTKVKACKDRKTNRKHKHFPTLFENVKKFFIKLLTVTLYHFLRKYAFPSILNIFSKHK